jgi:hypothetical protein
LKNTLFILVFVFLFGLACPAANAGSQTTDELKKPFAIAGLVAGIGEDSLAVSDRVGTFFIQNILNLELYQLPLMAAAEREQPIYVQLKPAGNGNCIISFLRLLSISSK